ncbi:MAG: low molecular weight phosphotyrosine protein phosphatase [Acholeplasmatales bacterium]|nr:low molecular weight phosphotyrosine protein phosphatase [Acholeplasmatales bacterium]
MHKILFVCHGNICRSPMAEYLFKKMVSDNHQESNFEIDSAATSREEIGNGVYYGARGILDRFKIDYRGHHAKQITKEMYDYYDLIIIMDHNNYYNLTRLMGFDVRGKTHLLLEYAGINRDISDPWYTDDFDKAYDDIMLGLNGLYKYLVNGR